MIERKPAFVTSDGETFAELIDAQRHEIARLLNIEPLSNIAPVDVLDAIVEHRDKLVDILTTTATSKTRARKVNGGRKTRKPATAATV